MIPRLPRLPPRESPLKYSTFGKRFLAGFVDGLVFIPVNFLDGYLSKPARGAAVLILWAVISYTTYWLYSVLMHARYGQTLGKMVADVEVLDQGESLLPTLGQAFLREIGYIMLNTGSLLYFIYLVSTGHYVGGPDQEVNTLPGTILSLGALGWFLLEVVTMFTNSKRRALHDFIAGTVVVRC